MSPPDGSRRCTWLTQPSKSHGSWPGTRQTCQPRRRQATPEVSFRLTIRALCRTGVWRLPIQVFDVPSSCAALGQDRWCDDHTEAARERIRPSTDRGGSMEYFVWMTTRKIRAGALDDFEHVWQPDPYPEGLIVPTPIGPRTAKKSLASPSGTQRNHATLGGAQRPRNGVAKQWRPTCSNPKKRSTEVANWAFLAANLDS